VSRVEKRRERIRLFRGGGGKWIVKEDGKVKEYIQRGNIFKALGGGWAVL
jgi:hypothetical protein